MITTADSIRTIEIAPTQASSGRPKESRRFTLDGSAELEKHLERTCQQVLAGVRRLIPGRRLAGLLLGGGYGRGEGGVLKTGAGDRPYNDLEFYVFLRGNNFLNERRYHAVFDELGRQLSPVAGVEVEFKVLSLAKLRHRLQRGAAAVLERHRDAGGIPLAEATRLLLNRCSGLLFARERLERAAWSPEDADFVGRNLAKTQLACGDAVLTAFGQYHWSCLERHRRLRRLKAPEDLPWLSETRRHHHSGVAFKLRPRRTAASRSATSSERGNRGCDHSRDGGAVVCAELEADP